MDGSQQVVKLVGFFSLYTNWQCHLGVNFKDTLLIQYRFPVGFGPSSNT